MLGRRRSLSTGHEYRGDYAAHTRCRRTGSARQVRFARWCVARVVDDRRCNPPRGAYVFYDSWHGSADLGHVGISLGNGTMIHDYGCAGVRITPIGISLHYIGWAAPPLSPGITDWKTPPAS